MVKRKAGPTLEEEIARPWCWYCDRSFDDLRVLIDHQRAKHFKCDSCNRRLNTANGLRVHSTQVHKVDVTEIKNTIDGRQDPGIEIYGVTGVPEHDMAAHNRQITDAFLKQEIEHRARTGNPPAGTKSDGKPLKKAKMETPEELKARLAEFRARKRAQAEASAGGNASATAESPTNNEATNSAHASPMSAAAAGYTPQASAGASSYPAINGITSSAGRPAFEFASSPVNPVGYPPPTHQAQPPIPHNGYPGAGFGAPMQFMSSPAFSATQPQPPTTYSPVPVQAPSMIARGLPHAPQLPARPNIPAPALGQDAMARLHQPGNGYYYGQSASPVQPPPSSQTSQKPANFDMELDDLINDERKKAANLHAAHGSVLPVPGLPTRVSQPDPFATPVQAQQTTVSSHPEGPVAAHAVPAPSSGELAAVAPTKIPAQQPAAAEAAPAAVDNSGEKKKKKKSKHLPEKGIANLEEKKVSVEELRAIQHGYDLSLNDA